MEKLTPKTGEQSPKPQKERVLRKQRRPWLLLCLSAENKLHRISREKSLLNLLAGGRAVFLEVGTEDSLQGVKEQRDGKSFQGSKRKDLINYPRAQDKKNSKLTGENKMQFLPPGEHFRSGKLRKWDPGTSLCSTSGPLQPLRLVERPLSSLLLKGPAEWPLTAALLCAWRD